jgi:hypothetical protein
MIAARARQRCLTFGKTTICLTRRFAEEYEPPNKRQQAVRFISSINSTREAFHA